MNVQKVIKEQGYTISECADKLGISRVTLSQNLSRNPTIATLKKIAEAIGCQVGDFFVDEISPTRLQSLTCPKCGARLKLVLDTE